MSLFWVVIEISATLIEALILFSFFDSFFKRTMNHRVIYWILPVFHTSFVSILNAWAMNQVSTALMTIALSCVLVFVFYQGGIFIRFGLMIAFYAIWMTSELVVLTVFSAFSEAFVVNVQQPSIERITMIVASKLTIFVILKFIQQFSTTNRFKLPFKKLLPLYVLPLSTIMIIISMQLFWTNEPSSARFMLAGISQICLLFANFIVFDQYRRFVQDAEVIAQINQIKQNQAVQIERAEMIKAQEKDIRKMAHDLENRLLPAVMYLRQGKPDQSLETLEQLTETLNNLQKPTEITGHAMLDLILTFKISKARTDDVKIKVDRQMDAPVLVPDEDISVMLGNALDNAIEAVAKLNDKYERVINLQLRSGHGIFTIKITNSVDQDVVIQNGKIKSTKINSRNHGIGLNSIRNLVNKNHGFLDLQSKDKTFTLSISLENLPLNAKNQPLDASILN